MKKKFKRLFAFAMSIILVCASFVFAASAEDRGKILDEELKEIMAAASDDDIINKVFIGLETGFDKSEFEAKYGTGDEYIAAISAFFRDHTDRFIEKLPEDLKADIDHTDPYAACIWFNTTAKNIYRLSEYEEVTGIGYGEYTMHAEETYSIIDEDLIDLLNNANEDDVFSVGVELNYQFDESTVQQPDNKDAAEWKNYRQRLIEAANEFYTEKNTSFCESIKDLVTVTEIDTLGAVFWCDITKENIYKISEKEEVIHIFLDNMTPVAVPVETTEPQHEDVPLAPLGDVNLDMKVTAADAREILRYAAQLSNNVYNRENADLNSDGKINAADARLALRTAARLNANKEVPGEAAVDKSKLDIRELSGSNVYDLSDPRQLVASMSYVFAAKVLRAVDYQTEFNKAATPDDVREIKDEAMTFLEIEVVENLKGNLKLHTRIPYFKAGGVTADKKYIELFEHDLIPEEGKYYVFVAYAREGGTLIGGCEYGCAALEDGITEKNLNESSILQTYRDACANPAPVINDRDYLHNLAKYDTDFVG